MEPVEPTLIVAPLVEPALPAATFTSILSPSFHAAVPNVAVPLPAKILLAIPARLLNEFELVTPATPPVEATFAEAHSLNSPVFVFITRKRI